MLTLLAKLFQALNSESSSRQIALAIALGFAFGLAPLVSLHNLVILFIALFIRVHLSSFILSATVFSGISYLFSFALVGFGETLLTSQSLQGLFNSLYQFDWFKIGSPAPYLHLRCICIRSYDNYPYVLFEPSFC